jgi:hypothetical protein
LSVEGVVLQRQLKLIYDERMSFTPIARALLLYLTDIFPSLQALVQT